MSASVVKSKPMSTSSVLAPSLESKPKSRAKSTRKATTTRTVATKKAATTKAASKAKPTAKKASGAAASKAAASGRPSWKDIIKECIALNKEDARVGVSRATIKKVWHPVLVLFYERK